VTIQRVNYSPSMVNASLAYRYTSPESGYAQLVDYPWTRQEFHRPRASWGSIRNFNTGWGEIWESGQGFRAIGTGQTVRAPLRTTEVSTAPFGAVVESGYNDAYDYTSEEMAADPEWCCGWFDFGCTSSDCVALLAGEGSIPQRDYERGIVDPRDAYTPGMDEDVFITRPEDDPAERAKRAKEKLNPVDNVLVGAKCNQKPIPWGCPGATTYDPTRVPNGTIINEGPDKLGATGPGAFPWLLVGLAAAGGYALWRANK
jgi:hypothetical protein